MRKINRAEEYQLQFLRREVDRTMEQWIAKPQHPDLSSNANQAQKELRGLNPDPSQPNQYIRSDLGSS